MNISEFLSTLPKDVVRGEGIALSESVIKKMFKIAGLCKNDVLYYLGCGQGEAVLLAAENYGVKRAVGVEPDKKLALTAKRKVTGLKNAEIINSDILNVDISGATVVMLWFSDTSMIEELVKKFRKTLKDGARVVTVWSPPGMMLPQKVEFPFFVCIKPFKYAASVRQQIRAVYGNKCIDFTAAWLLAEKFIDAMETVPQEYRRFVNMLQGMVIWINAWNMGVTCEDGVPPPVTTYIGILREFFGIDLSDMFTRSPKNESSIPPDKMGCC